MKITRSSNGTRSISDNDGCFPLAFLGGGGCMMFIIWLLWAAFVISLLGFVIYMLYSHVLAPTFHWPPIHIH